MCDLANQFLRLLGASSPFFVVQELQFFLSPFQAFHKCTKRLPLLLYPLSVKIGMNLGLLLGLPRLIQISDFGQIPLIIQSIIKVRLHKIWESADDLRSNFGRICKQSLVFFKKRIWLVRGLNPGPLACEASVLTIQLLPLLKEIMKTWEVILILVCFEILPLWLLPFLPTSF